VAAASLHSFLQTDPPRQTGGERTQRYLDQTTRKSGKDSRPQAGSARNKTKNAQNNELAGLLFAVRTILPAAPDSALSKHQQKKLIKSKTAH